MRTDPNYPHIDLDEFDKYKDEMISLREIPFPMAIWIAYSLEERNAYFKDLRENFPDIYDKLVEDRREFRSLVCVEEFKAAKRLRRKIAKEFMEKYPKFKNVFVKKYWELFEDI